MKRHLVLTTESARHPFRQTLPMAVTSVQPTPREPLTDAAFFALSFVSCFVIIFGMII
jgi:hypothetical protein